MKTWSTCMDQLTYKANACAEQSAGVGSGSPRQWNKCNQSCLPLSSDWTLLNDGRGGFAEWKKVEAFMSLQFKVASCVLQILSRLPKKLLYSGQAVCQQLPTSVPTTWHTQRSECSPVKLSYGNIDITFLVCLCTQQWSPALWQLLVTNLIREEVLKHWQNEAFFFMNIAFPLFILPVLLGAIINGL